MVKFSVDTHLFRELGELLVGRDSTALVELVKNSYDADATWVTVHAERLDDTERGFIRITDDGTGMTPEEFENGFLRIASRNKEQGDRRSRRFSRRFTGAKGIGRLAAHKLARLIEIASNPWNQEPQRERRGIKACIDWDEIERQPTLDRLDEQALSIEEPILSPEVGHGTVITLRKLRRPWSREQLVARCGSPESLSR